MARVNAWMAAGVGVTALVAFLISQNSAVMISLFGSGLIWLFVFAPVVFVWIFVSRIHKMAPTTAIAMFLLYAALNGVSLSSIFIVYSLGSIASVFAVTVVMYAALSLFGFVTKRDMSGLGRFLFMALIGLVVSSIFFMFVPGMMGSTAYLIYNVIGVLIFAGLTAYETQKLKQMYLTSGGQGNLAVYGALTLYLDFINLFLFLLRLFGNRD
ncbi:Bax inhibitor-1/YccA family protein [Nannocystaceae bacterium ST9]